jgi:Uma2 family endonuclease
LVVEVADTSLRKDRRKSRTYAAAGVPEYWIVNLVDVVVEVYAGLSGGKYTETRTHRAPEAIRSLAFSDIPVPLAEILAGLRH